MKISQALEALTQIKDKYGDISITGGCMMDDVPLSNILVTDAKGCEVWPNDPNNVAGKRPINGVFLE